MRITAFLFIKFSFDEGPTGNRFLKDTAVCFSGETNSNHTFKLQLKELGIWTFIDKIYNSSDYIVESNFHHPIFKSEFQHKR